MSYPLKKYTGFTSESSIQEFDPLLCLLNLIAYSGILSMFLSLVSTRNLN